ncbi:MAG: type II toxin-antitoxin system RelE/ParE family toxin [Propionibacteriaceae bacterium]|nr:type II toxin-antitoxin system RelE/ParE family toxin [Propionibacteriaceae bacterium]
MYRIEYTRSADKTISKLPSSVRSAIIKRVQALGNDPRPRGAIKLTGSEDEWRIRIGDYRVVYVIDDGVLTVLVVRVGHRSDIYRGR